MGAIEVLRRATDAGFTVGIADGKLAVTGPTDQPGIIDDIKHNRDAIIEALSAPPAHYADRLRRGMDWLLEAWGRIPDDTTPALIAAFDRNLHAWRDLEEEMHRLYPYFNGCPIGDCVNDQPVKCDACADRRHS